MVKPVDTLISGVSEETRAGSNPVIRMITQKNGSKESFSYYPGIPALLICPLFSGNPSVLRYYESRRFRQMIFFANHPRLLI